MNTGTERCEPRSLPREQCIDLSKYYSFLAAYSRKMSVSIPIQQYTEHYTPKVHTTFTYFSTYITCRRAVPKVRAQGGLYSAKELPA